MALTAAELARRQNLLEPLRLGEDLTQGELAGILRDAGTEAQAMVRDNLLRGTFSSTVRARQLETAMKGMGQLSRSTWGRIGGLVRQGIGDAASLSADQAVRRLRGLGVSSARAGQFSNLIHFDAERVAQDIINRHQFGFKLSERIYRNGQATVMQVGQIIDKGLAKQLSARELAGSVRMAFSPDVPGGPSYAAMRLARTEINNAHHDTTVQLAKRQPWVEGFVWHLSGSHPRPDPCDDLADKSPYSTEEVPGKPHPQCLCYLEVQQQDRASFLRDLHSGRFDGAFT